MKIENLTLSFGNKTVLEKVNFEKLFKTNKELLVEKFISGIEVTVGILKNDVLPPIEIVPPVGQMFDYNNKYNGKTQEIPNAPSLNESQKNKVMKITTETNLLNFDAWSGAIETKNTIIDSGLDQEFEALIEEIYPEGLTDTQLNDILRFESDWIFEVLGIKEEDED